MLELVIMTSDDTHSKTKALLDDNSYFGMMQKQLHLVKQEKVGASRQEHCLLVWLGHSCVHGCSAFVCRCRFVFSCHSCYDQGMAANAMWYDHTPRNCIGWEVFPGLVLLNLNANIQPATAGCLSGRQ